MKRIFCVLISLFACLLCRAAWGCSETANPFTLRTVPMEAGAARTAYARNDARIVPVPPEFESVDSGSYAGGQRITATVRFPAQKSIGANRLLMPVEQVAEDSGLRRVWAYVEDGKYSSGNPAWVRYDMDCIAACAHEISTWQVRVPATALPAPGTTVYFYVGAGDEYGNVASEHPEFLSAESAPDYKTDQWPAVQDPENDEPDNASAKADISGFRAAFDEQMNFWTEISYRGQPGTRSEEPGGLDHLWYFHSMNIFRSDANQGQAFTGQGQTILNLNLPLAAYYVDCGIGISVNDGACYLSSDEDPGTSSQCTWDSSPYLKGKQSEAWVGDHKIVLQTDAQYVAIPRGPDTPESKQFVTLAAAVSFITYVVPMDMELSDITAGMNLYPRNHQFVVSSNQGVPAQIALEPGWNLLYVDELLDRENLSLANPWWVLNGGDAPRNSLQHLSMNKALALNALGAWVYSPGEAVLNVTTGSDSLQRDTREFVLRQGLNIIGPGWSANVVWGGAAMTFESESVKMTMEQAVAQGFTDGRLYAYGQNGYQLVPAGAPMHPARGYFLIMNKPGTLVFAP